MKTALVILTTCLLALAHLNEAQLSLQCPSIEMLRPQCTKKRNTPQDFNDFCTGSCFGEVLTEFQACERVVPGFSSAMRLQECEK